MRTVKKAQVIEIIILFIVCCSVGIFIMKTDIPQHYKNCNVSVIIASFPFMFMYLVMWIVCFYNIYELWIKYINRKKILNSENIEIDADIKSIRSKVLRVEEYDKIYVYFIVCTWTNPSNGKNYTFKSDILWYKPDILDKRSMKVLINPYNPKVYYMDINELIIKDEMEKFEKDYLIKINDSIKFKYQLTNVEIIDNYLIGKDKKSKKDLKINLKKVKSITKLHKNEEKEVLLETYTKNILIKKITSETLLGIEHGINEKCKNIQIRC